MKKLYVLSFFLSIFLSGFSQVNIWLEDFESLSNKTTVDNGSTSWTRDITHANITGTDAFEVGTNSSQKVFTSSGVDGYAIWQSQLIDISGYNDVTLGVNLKSNGNPGIYDSIQVYYRLDNGTWNKFANGTQTGNFLDANPTVTGLSGNNVQIRIKVTVNASSDQYLFDNIIVQGSRNWIWTENFEDLTLGDKVDNGITAWSVNTSGATIGGSSYFEVKPNKRFESDINGGLVIWSSEVIDIDGFTNVLARLLISSSGNLESPEDYIKAYYILDGGAEVLIGNGEFYGNVTSQVASTSGLVGSTIQIVVKMSNNANGEFYSIDDIFLAGDATPLPITLKYFNAKMEGSMVKFEWLTSAEINNDYFVIELYNEFGEWEEISEVVGAGNSNRDLLYESYDKNPKEGNSYYRLKQVDFNGQYSYSDLVALSIHFDKDGLCEINVLPNPCSPLCDIVLDDCSQKENQMVSFYVYDAMGNRVKAFVPQNVSNGSVSFTLESNSLMSSGLYFVKGDLGDKVVDEKIIVK